MVVQRMMVNFNITHIHIIIATSETSTLQGCAIEREIEDSLCTASINAEE